MMRMDNAEMNETMLEQVNGGAWYDTLKNIGLNTLNIAVAACCVPFAVVIDSGQSIYEGEMDYERTQSFCTGIADQVTHITDPL